MKYFNRFTLATPESVELEFALAGIGNRALALLIDYHVLALAWVLVTLLWFTVSLQLMDYLSQLQTDYSSVPLWLLAIYLLVTFALYTGYFVFFEVSWQGQTPGKRFAKIRVIRDDGRPVGLSQAILRTLLRPIDDLFFLGALLIVIGKQEKRIGDRVAGTLVVQENRPILKNDLHCSETAQTLAVKLPELTQLEQLQPDDFAVIREYLRRRPTLTKRSRGELSMKLAHQIKTLIQLETIPPELTSDDFLEAVYLAYQGRSSSPLPGESTGY
ncbi:MULTISPECIES: RDD family protein [unclassified Leptolyngbya]|uniref:RDD family protein n=1 Tax=unclassified Leptolyngbya TaxID=2650499 RepID=UPI0016877495|nr:MULTISPECIES: RDD family protein [unclassified Leptolyngbya]MBD1914138.1 RDD family protein [Leptolyngbya sp. FACHB-8]MBD2155912.1 RDD family protein [Leptolyngbya sp. FACHB-16]